MRKKNIYENMNLVHRSGDWAEPGYGWAKFANFSNRSEESLHALGYLAGEILLQTIGHETIALENPERFEWVVEDFGILMNPPLGYSQMNTFREAAKLALLDYDAAEIQAKL